MAIETKHGQYNPLINTLKNNGWEVTPLITITQGVRGAVHEHTTDKLMKLNILTKQHKKSHESHPPYRHQISHIPHIK